MVRRLHIIHLLATLLEVAYGTILAVSAALLLGTPIMVAAAEPINSTNTSGDTSNGADLLARIDRALSRLPKPSDYLYEMSSVSGQVAGTWTEMTAGILGTKDLRVAYDDFYISAVEYSGMVEVNLRRAKKAILNNDLERGKHLYNIALRYEQQFRLNDSAAIETYNGNIDASAELTRGIYEGSKASAIYGSSMVMGPVGSRVVDAVFDATDFAVEASDNGLSSATRTFIADKLTEMIFSQATIASLGGKTLGDAIDRGVTKALGNPDVYKIVHEVVSRSVFTRAFMSFMAKSGAYKVEEITEDQVNKIIVVILEGAANEAPPVTACGSRWYQRLGLQLLEAEQATRGGYSFDAACKAHDACYGNCRTSRPDCDKKLLEDAKGTCDSARNRENCIADAQIFFQAVSEKGDAPFRQARANCPGTAQQGYQNIDGDSIGRIRIERPAVSIGTPHVSGQAILEGPDVKALDQPPTRLTQIDICLLYQCGGDRVTAMMNWDIFAAPDPASMKLGVISAGNEFQPITAAWVTHAPSALRVKSRWTSEQNPAYSFEPGDLIYLYADWGEGCYTAWTRGYLYGYFTEGNSPHPPGGVRKDLIHCLAVDPNSQFVEWIQQGSYENWLGMSLSNGSTGWVNPDQNASTSSNKSPTVSNSAAPITTVQ